MCGLVLLLALLAGTIAALTFLMLPAVAPNAGQWAQLAVFILVSALYMAIFGLVGLGAAAAARSEIVGLLVPVTLWLTLTFILPQLTANLNPTAAINPVSALAPPPDTSFFRAAGQILGPFSLADAYKFASARLLDYLPQGIASPCFIPPVADLVLAALFATAFAWRKLVGLPMEQGDYNV